MTRLACAAAVVLLALAASACGDSPDDRAHDSGREVGKAVRHLADARSATDVQNAAADLRAALGGLDSHTLDRVRAQIGPSQNRIVATVRAAMEPATFAAARGELRRGAQEVRGRADALRSGGDSRTAAFWRGFAEGFDGG